jgi:hypothetical protein
MSPHPGRPTAQNAITTEKPHLEEYRMNAWRMIVVSTALVPVIAISGCGPKQPAGPDADRGQCFQQAACTGGSLLQDNPPTLNQCKAAGGKSWSGITQKGCASF